MDTRFPHPISDDDAASAERTVRFCHKADIPDGGDQCPLSGVKRIIEVKGFYFRF
jgi:hypothetical protein